MRRPIRIMLLRPRTYAIVLATLAGLGFAAGFVANLDHARSHPGADPYAAGNVGGR